jgi:hypothetical protein
MGGTKGNGVMELRKKIAQLVAAIGSTLVLLVPNAGANLAGFSASPLTKTIASALMQVVRVDTLPEAHQPPSDPLAQLLTHEVGPELDMAELRTFAKTQNGPFDQTILNAAVRWNLDPFLLKGLLANESRLDPIRLGKYRVAEHEGTRVIVSGGAAGIAQFSGGGIRAMALIRERQLRRGKPALTFDRQRALIPDEAIHAAAEFLRHLINRYGRDGGITAYNSGVVGGKIVQRMGFWRAKASGKLSRSGIYHLQGERFLLNVLKKVNYLRRGAGLIDMPLPRGGPRHLSS